MYFILYDYEFLIIFYCVNNNNVKEERSKEKKF